MNINNTHIKELPKSNYTNEEKLKIMNCFFSEIENEEKKYREEREKNDIIEGIGLYKVHCMGYDNDFSLMVISDSKLHAEDKVIEMKLDGMYNCYAERIDEVDGYKIEVKLP